jgi:hypothetical protein
MKSLLPGDALLIVDVQNDFVANGALAVPGGREVIPVLRRYLALFAEHGLPVFATRDWHPPDHCSFRQHRAGLGRPHCVAGLARGSIACHRPSGLLRLGMVTIYERRSTPRQRGLLRHCRTRRYTIVISGQP